MRGKIRIGVLLCVLLFFVRPLYSGQKKEDFDEFDKALMQSEKEQRTIKKKRVLEIKDRIRQQSRRKPSSIELTADVDFENLFESGPSEPILTDKGSDYSGLDTFKSEVELEPINIDFERESKEVKRSF